MLLSGLKEHSSNLTAVVTVADDGGSSGLLRRGLGVLPPGDIRSCLVALADDDEDVRFLMTRMLKKAGVRQVKTFPGGEALLASLVSGPLPDLVILDQNMPGLDGIQTMGRIRARHQDLPILISSGQPDVEAWACFQGPAASVIAKPFTMEEIKAKLAILAGKLHPDEPGS